MRGLQHENRQCYAFSTDMEVVLVCTVLDGRKRGESEDITLLNVTWTMYFRVKCTAPRAQDPKMFTGIVLRAKQDERVRFFEGEEGCS